MRRRSDLVPLADRLAALQGARLVLAAVVVVTALAVGGTAGVPDTGLVPLTVAFVLVTTTFEAVRRLLRRRALELVSSLLLVDGLYLAVVVAESGGVGSHLLFLVHLHVVATTLLVSFRSGLVLSLWHVLLLVATHQWGWWGPGGTASEVLVVCGSFVLVGAAAAAFAALNERALRWSRRAARSLAELGATLEGCDALDEVLTSSATHLRVRLGCQRAVVLVRHEGRWAGAVGEAGSTAALLTGPDAVASDIADPASTSLQLVGTIDAATAPVLDRALPGSCNVAVMPLVADGEPVGVTAMEFGPRRSVLPRAELELLEQSVARIALSVRAVQLRAEIERLATSDPLTGLPNRRVLDGVLAREVARSRRSGTPLSVALLDVDHFKDVNDRHGHPVGDAVLCELATALQTTIRPESVVARYGGEEFAVVLPDATPVEAVAAGERLRSAAATVEAVSVTVSVGVAALDDGMAGPDELVEAADTALYEAKAAGRDRTVCHAGGLLVRDV